MLCLTLPSLGFGGGGLAVRTLARRSTMSPLMIADDPVDLQNQIEALQTKLEIAQLQAQLAELEAKAAAVKGPAEQMASTPPVPPPQSRRLLPWPCPLRWLCHQSRLTRLLPRQPPRCSSRFPLRLPLSMLPLSMRPLALPPSTSRRLLPFAAALALVPAGFAFTKFVDERYEQIVGTDGDGPSPPSPMAGGGPGFDGAAPPMAGSGFGGAPPTVDASAGAVRASAGALRNAPEIFFSEWRSELAKISANGWGDASAKTAGDEAGEPKEDEAKKLLQKVKEAGVAGAISYAAWELGSGALGARRPRRLLWRRRPLPRLEQRG